MKKMFLLVSLALACAGPAFAEMTTGSLTIQSGQSAHTFAVEIADEQDEISLGLMHRPSLADNAGMLFDFGQPREANMWMKNTLIPLDMLFVTQDGKIVAIARNTVPGSLRRINPGVPVKGVVELKGGRAKALGIEPGDTVKHKIFGNTDG